jgi:hypothetical protein
MPPALVTGIRPLRRPVALAAAPEPTSPAHPTATALSPCTLSRHLIQAMPYYTDTHAITVVPLRCRDAVDKPLNAKPSTARLAAPAGAASKQTID